MYPQSLPKRGGKLIPNSVLQCYLIHIPAYWGKTCSEHSLIALSQWGQYALESMMQDGYLKNYRPCWSAKSPLNVIKPTSNLLFYVIYVLLMPLFHSQAAILKTKQQLSSWIVASGHREHVMISIFQMKSRPKCQIDEDSVCSQTFFFISPGLLETNREYCLCSLHCTQGLGPLLQTQAICLSDFIVNVNASVPFSDQGDWMWSMYFLL